MNSNTVLKVASVLWVIWGLVHMFAGIITMARPAAAAVLGIADAADPAIIDAVYPAAAGAIINQHGFNLLWIGAFATIGGVFVWRGSAMWIVFTAVVAGLADVGYFVFLDLGGFVNFIPGTLMTVFSATAIVLSFGVLWARRGSPAAA